MLNSTDRVRGRVVSAFSAVSLWCLAFPLSLFAQTSSSQIWHPVIPRSWDPAQLESWTIPPRMPGVHTVHLPPSFVYTIPAYPIYKTYPIYHPAKEPDDTWSGSPGRTPLSLLTSVSYFLNPIGSRRANWFSKPLRNSNRRKSSEILSGTKSCMSRLLQKASFQGGGTLFAKWGL